MSEAMTVDEYKAEAVKRFGENNMKWRFKCPSCGFIASTQDYKDAGAPSGAVGFSCVGRWQKGHFEEAFKGEGGPCNYAGGGLICINPVKVTDPDGNIEHYFELAEVPKQNDNKD